MKIALLSPHRDDVAFSCSYFILAGLRARFDLTVVTIFTVSDYAPFAQSADSPDIEAVSALRRREDERFVEAVGAAVPGGSPPVLTDLGWKDCPIRHGVDPEKMFKTVIPVSPQEDRCLADAFLPFAACDLVLAPLALGHHPDHELVRRAARLGVPDARLGYYEDLPYAYYLKDQAERAAFIPSGLTACKIAPPEGGRLKYRAAMCYPSQIREEEAERLQAYTDGLGGAERLHLPPDAFERLQAILPEFLIVA